MLVHGEAGVGKSRLAATAPTPRLILDAEGRAKHLPLDSVAWNPLTENPPEAPETCVVDVTNFDVLSTVYQWLDSGQLPFKSVLLDSLMEIQKRLMDQLRGVEALQTQDWGVVLRRLEALVRSYRDLVNRSTNAVDVVVITCGSRNEDGVQRPLLQGQISSTLPYYLDVVGYMYVSHRPDGSGIDRSLLVQPSPTAVAKDGTGRELGPVINQPNITEIYNQLNGGPTQ